MITKRMKLKLLRMFFKENLRTPLRLPAQHFGELIADLFGEKRIDEGDVSAMMKQAGFLERRNIKGTFYVKPTPYLFMYAEENGIDVSCYFED